MTKSQAMEKIKELLPGLEKYLLKRCQAILDSGALNLESYKSDLRAPKLILTVALHDATGECFSPLPWDREGKRIVMNLRRF